MIPGIMNMAANDSLVFWCNCSQPYLNSLDSTRALFMLGYSTSHSQQRDRRFLATPALSSTEVFNCMKLACSEALNLQWNCMKLKSDPARLNLPVNLQKKNAKTIYSYQLTQHVGLILGHSQGWAFQFAP